jgi:hypothetical protein
VQDAKPSTTSPAARQTSGFTPAIQIEIRGWSLRPPLNISSA